MRARRWHGLRSRASGDGVLAKVLVTAYSVSRFRGSVLWLLRRIEGHELFSPTLRVIFRKYWGVDVGMYTHGECFEPWAVDEQTTIGRYCSLAKGCRIVNHNHPGSFKGTSGLFFNPALGLSDRWLVAHRPLVIGNDVWIGAGAIVLPEVDRIGDGAIIGAGSVVSRDVPPYAVVLGNPGRVVKYRFSPEVIEQLLAEKWWEQDLPELARHIQEFQRPWTGDDPVPDAAQLARQQTDPSAGPTASRDASGQRGC